jgi:hypothetical protein
MGGHDKVHYEAAGIDNFAAGSHLDFLLWPISLAMLLFYAVGPRAPIPVTLCEIPLAVCSKSCLLPARSGN